MCFCDYLCLPLSLDLRAEAETLLLIHVSLETNTEWMFSYADADSVQVCLHPLVFGDSWGRLVTWFWYKSCPWGFGLPTSCFACFDVEIWEDSKTVFPPQSQPSSQNPESLWIFMHMEKKSVLKVLSDGSPWDPGDDHCSQFGAPCTSSKCRYSAWFLHRHRCILLFALPLALCFDIVPSQYTEYFPI